MFLAGARLPRLPFYRPNLGHVEFLSSAASLNLERELAQRGGLSVWQRQESTPKEGSESIHSASSPARRL